MSADKSEALTDPVPLRETQVQEPSEECLENLDPHLLLAHFVDTMLPLSEEEQKRFDAQLGREENKKVRELLSSLNEAIGQRRGEDLE